MQEYEEFEGLRGVAVDISNIPIDEDDDAALGAPEDATKLMPSEVFSQLEKRGLKTSGFQDIDVDVLQRAFDEEFKNELEQRRAKRREQLRKDAQQRGLRQRRLDMERSLQEEQDELAKNHQIGRMIEMIKENSMGSSLRINVSSISARSLAKAMWINDTITCLDLSSNDLNDHAGAYLARILKRNSTLKKLELDNNRLGSKACAAFGESLQSNTSLVYLSLDSNPIASDHDISGLNALANSLKVNKTLTSLNLWRTNIPEHGGRILASALEMNDTLLFCDIGHNYISIGDVQSIVQKLDANLASFEASERHRRKHELVLAEQRRKEEQEEVVSLDSIINVGCEIIHCRCLVESN